MGPEKHEIQVPELSELREMDDDRIVELYDSVAGKTPAKAEFYLGELHRREQKRRSKEMREMTGTIRNLTWVIAGLTVITAAASIINACSAG